MNSKYPWTTALLLAMCSVTAISAGATETINLSYADAAATGYGECMGVADVGWMAKDPYQINNVNGCTVEFALPVPAGHLVKQITVLHGTSCDQNQPCWNNTLQTSAYLVYQFISGPFNGIGVDQFYWSSNDPVEPLGSVQTTYLMTQAKNYPDAFVTQLDRIYHVTVEVHNFASVSGIQVTYD